MFLWFFKFFVLDYFLDFSFFLFWPLLLEPRFLLPSSFSVFFYFFFVQTTWIFIVLSFYFFFIPFGLPSLPFILWCLWLGRLLRHIYYVIFFMYIFDFSIFLTVIIDNFLGLTVWYDVQQKQSVNLGNRCSCSDSYIALSCIFSLFSVRETSS